MTDVQSSEGEIETLLAAIRALGTSPDPEHLLETLVEIAVSVTGSSAGAFWSCDDAGHDLTLTVPARNPPPRLESGHGLVGRCTHTHAVLHVDNLDDAREDLSDLRAVHPDRVFRSGAALNVPLLTADDRVLGVLQLLHRQGGGFTVDAMNRTRLLAAHAALALRHARLAAATQQTSRLHDEVEVAREIQRSTLPEQMPQVSGYDLHSHFQPATYAGGDLLDAVKLAHGVFLLVGDATGHGFGPALSAVQMQGMLRVAFRMGADLDSAYLHVNNQLAEDLPEDRFITAFMGILDAGTHTVSYHSAGQGPILHYHAADGRCQWHQPSTFPLGVLALPQVTGTAQTLLLEPGDVLALISDGMYERTNPRDEEFGQDRVGDIVRRGHALPMAELCRMLLSASGQFADGCAQADDITMILICRTTNAAR